MNSNRDNTVYNTYDENDPSISAVPVFARGSGALSPYAQAYGSSLNLSFAHDNEGGDFLYAEDANKKRSWGDKVFYGTGAAYMIGSAAGGVWGVAEGLKNPEAITRRLKINSVLNSVTRRGPFVGNFAGVLALMYTVIDGSLVWLRDGQDDYVNSVSAAALTGVLFKTTGGVRAMGMAGVLGVGIIGSAAAAKHLFEQRQTY
eukprot:comp14619_c0_seq1/m.10911 comp14619_c0_seq1/g.10911  ORF comp14619_c0_seq1/g.10911 comp14619_c0_seq1/m.10911 type:complete len:202 (-) comp14619_c0_seq1:546-1151(-)